MKGPIPLSALVLCATAACDPETHTAAVDAGSPVDARRDAMPTDRGSVDALPGPADVIYSDVVTPTADAGLPDLRTRAGALVAIRALDLAGMCADPRFSTTSKTVAIYYPLYLYSWDDPFQAGELPLWCGLNARSCDEFFQCPLFQADASCSGVGLSGQCLENQYTNCWAPGFRRVISCPEGRICELNAQVQFQSFCAYPSDCENNLEYFHCGGDAIGQCLIGSESRFSCRLRAACEPYYGPTKKDSLLLTNSLNQPCYSGIADTCAIDAAGETLCAGSGPPCEAFPSRCEGNVLVSCVGGHESRHDCADLMEGFTCHPDSGPYGATCWSNEEECNTFDAPVSCDGDRIRFCLFGRWESIDCAGFGAECTTQSPVEPEGMPGRPRCRVPGTP